MSARSRGTPRHSVPGRAWRALLASVPTAAILSIVVTATPVLADCAALNAAFPPGNWSGRISNIATQDFDQLSVAVTDGFGAFDLFVDHDGSVQGTMSFQATGEAAMTDILDEGSSSAQFLIAAEAAGTPTLVTLDGEMEMTVETVMTFGRRRSSAPSMTASLRLARVIVPPSSRRLRSTASSR